MAIKADAVSNKSRLQSIELIDFNYDLNVELKFCILIHLLLWNKLVDC